MHRKSARVHILLCLILLAPFLRDGGDDDAEVHCRENCIGNANLSRKFAKLQAMHRPAFDREPTRMNARFMHARRRSSSCRGSIVQLSHRRRKRAMTIILDRCLSLASHVPLGRAVGRDRTEPSKQIDCGVISHAKLCALPRGG